MSVALDRNLISANEVMSPRQDSERLNASCTAPPSPLYCSPAVKESLKWHYRSLALSQTTDTLKVETKYPIRQVTAYFYINPSSDCGHTDRINISQYENYSRACLSAAVGTEWGVSPWKQISAAPLNTACYVPREGGKSSCQLLNTLNIKKRSLCSVSGFQSFGKIFMKNPVKNTR